MSTRRASFESVLIANRGEIVARVARSARDLGCRAIGVYSDADRHAPYLDRVDEAVAIGGASPSESYLSIERVIDAARRSGAGAIHPGYGFLSERAELAEACEAAGMVWIGPPPAVLRLLGDKAAAKQAMAAAGVPCVPGVDGRGLDAAALARAAGGLAPPLLVKAAAGGGGRGMRRVERLGELPAALDAARREAEAAFGCGDLLVERALDGARHVEVQVLFDAHGHGIHLGERDCSVQRRHQKIVEESPAPGLDPDTRTALCAAAVAGAGAAGYVGAGTLEFLVAADGGYHFLEMNARLQVEHPVTEMVTGIDLVEHQLRIAAGEPLSLRQEEVVVRGHAIEARLYAEDPMLGFVPQSGVVGVWREPAGGGVRVDHALRPGTTVPPHYDPMLAKIVAHGRDRAQALRVLRGAVERTRVLGVVTNKTFLLELLGSEAFVAGAVATDFAEGFAAAIAGGRRPAPPALAALAALLLTGAAERGAGAPAGGGLPWAVELEGGAGRVAVRGQSMAPGRHRLEVADEAVELELVRVRDDEVVYVADGVRRVAAWHRDGDALWVEAEGSIESYRPRTGARVAAESDDGEVRAPMAAQVVAVDAAAGTRVERGAPLVTLRAMKLEHRLCAPRAGTVREVLVEAGDQVAFRQVVVRLALGAAGGTEAPA